MSELLKYAERVWQGESTMADYHTGLLRQQGLWEVADGIALWPAFGNVAVCDGGDGLVFIDTGDARTAKDLRDAVRRWRPKAPLHTAIYSHGHIDHVFGVGPFDEEAAEAGRPRPLVVGHEALPARFDRYTRTAGYNTVINQRQFQNTRISWPTSYRYPDITYRDSLLLRRGELTFGLTHARGETDDHTYTWVPERKLLYAGDFFIWASPNAGNPQKVQRYPLEWAAALRHMASLGAEILLSGHGVPIAGAARISTALSDAAELLQSLHDQTVEMMNAGARLNEILHTVRAPQHLLDKPYLKPSYDEPEFVVHNVWRLYGGWYDGNPATLKPAPENALARELAGLAGGAQVMADRARVLAEQGELRLAGHLAETAALAAPDAPTVQATRAEVFRRLEQESTSTMAKGLYGWAAAESRALATGSDTGSEVDRAATGRTQWAFGGSVAGTSGRDGAGQHGQAEGTP